MIADAVRRWRRVNTGLPAAGVADLAVDAGGGRRLYVSTNPRGVFSATFE